MNEDRLKELLRSEPLDDERQAQERSWEVIQAAYAERAANGRRRPRRIVLAFAAGALLLVIGFSPAGAQVGEWIDDIVDPGVEDAEPALTSLPAPGNLLVASEQGAWVVHADGSKRLLGDYERASWSPNGLFVIATRGRELTAVTPAGEVRWSLASQAPVSAPRWSPSGFRIAYQSGHSLRVVAGDGAGDSPLVNRVAPVPSAWKPATDEELEASPTGVGTHRLAYSDPEGRISLIDVDSGERLWRSGPGPVPTQLEWSADGRLLFALQRDGVRLFEESGFIGAQASPAMGRLKSIASSPLASSYALLATDRTSEGAHSEVQLVQSFGKGPISTLFEDRGRFGPIAFSPDGRWLLVPWPRADQWLFLPTDTAPGRNRIRAVDGIAREFDPGGTGPAPFPRVEGWCCAP